MESTWGFRPPCRPRQTEMSMLVVRGAVHSETRHNQKTTTKETQADHQDRELSHVDHFKIVRLRAVIAELMHRNSAEIAIEHLGEVLENLTATTVLFVQTIRNHSAKFLQIVVDHRRVFVLPNEILGRFFVMEVEIENAVRGISVSPCSSSFYTIELNYPINYLGNNESASEEAYNESRIERPSC